MMIFLTILALLSNTALALSNVRTVSSTSCKAIPIYLGLGTTTQVILEQEPKVTLYADKKHFRIITNQFSPRSLAIIPYLDSNELNEFKDSRGRIPRPAALAALLDSNFKTDLFVFFENNNQLMFEMRFVEKAKSDRILKVRQVFKEGCTL